MLTGPWQGPRFTLRDGARDRTVVSERTHGPGHSPAERGIERRRSRSRRSGGRDVALDVFGNCCRWRAGLVTPGTPRHPCTPVSSLRRGHRDTLGAVQLPCEIVPSVPAQTIAILESEIECRLGSPRGEGLGVGSRAFSPCRGHVRLAERLMRRWCRWGSEDPDDTRSDALWGLILAARAFEPDRGTFGSYAAFSIEEAMQHQRRLRKPESPANVGTGRPVPRSFLLDVPVGEGREELLNMLPAPPDAEDSLLLADALRRLPARECLVLRLRYFHGLARLSVGRIIRMDPDAVARGSNRTLWRNYVAPRAMPSTRRHESRAGSGTKPAPLAPTGPAGHFSRPMASALPWLPKRAGTWHGAVFHDWLPGESRAPRARRVSPVELVGRARPGRPRGRGGRTGRGKVAVTLWLRRVNARRRSAMESRGHRVAMTPKIWVQQVACVESHALDVFGVEVVGCMRSGSFAQAASLIVSGMGLQFGSGRNTSRTTPRRASRLVEVTVELADGAARRPGGQGAAQCPPAARGRGRRSTRTRGRRRRDAR